MGNRTVRQDDPRRTGEPRVPESLPDMREQPTEGITDPTGLGGELHMRLTRDDGFCVELWKYPDTTGFWELAGAWLACYPRRRFRTHADFAYRGGRFWRVARYSV